MVTSFHADLERFSEPALAEQDGELMAEQGSFQKIPGIAIPYENVAALYLVSPSVIQLGCLRDGRLRVREPLEVTITEEDGQIVAEAEELNEFGYGNNLTEAVIDLQHAVSELYFSLEEEQKRLGQRLQAVWDKLRAKIEMR